MYKNISTSVLLSKYYEYYATEITQFPSFTSKVHNTLTTVDNLI